MTKTSSHERKEKKSHKKNHKKNKKTKPISKPVKPKTHKDENPEELIKIEVKTEEMSTVVMAA